MPGWTPLLIPGIVLLLADGYRLGHLSLWLDEAYTIDAANRPLSRILATAAHTDAVNGLYYMFMHAWIAVAGISAAALRWPSVLAMAVAAVFTAAIGRRLARAARLPAPALTGVLAGLLFVAAPQVTRYAQEARSYGLVTMCTTIATYLLLRALADGRWRWWAGYGAAIAAAGLFNLLALLLLAAHAVTVWAARIRQRRAIAPAGPASSAPAGEGTATPRPAPAVALSRWFAAAGGAVVVLSPLMVTGWRQSRQVSWLARPRLHAVTNLAVLFAGSNRLLPLVALLVAAGVIATMAGRPTAAPDVVTVAVPWLVLPPVILLAASQIHPLYDSRYVVYCLPALALLAAAGLASAARLAMATPLGKAAAGAVAWLPSALIVVLLAALVLGPQRSARLPSSRPDNLRKAAAIVAAHAHRGDAVLYLPPHKRVYSIAYPAPYLRLRDVALAKQPAAAANLIGTQVPAATLRARFTTVGRVWVISGRNLRLFRHPATRLEKTEIALLKPFRLIQRWHAGRGAILSLYHRG
jgi:mannosyltransferase